jgi:hypothetical protein
VAEGPGKRRDYGQPCQQAAKIGLHGLDIETDDRQGRRDQDQARANLTAHSFEDIPPTAIC